MNAFDATKPTVNTLKSSPFASSMLIRDEIDVADTLLPRCVSGFAKSVGPLRDASQRYDGKMTPPAAMRDNQLDHGAGFPSNERVRLRARRSSRPMRSRLEARPTTRRDLVEVDLVRRTGAETRVRPLRVEPGDVVVELAAERGSCQWNDRQQARALVLHRLDESLDDREASVLADGAEALLDAVTSAPGSELGRGELRAMVGDDVAGPAADGTTDASQPSRHLPGRRFLLKACGPDSSPREVIDDDGDPPTERPALWDGERPPGNPEAADRWDRCQVDVPHVVRDFRGYGSRFRGATSSGSRFRRRFQHATHGGRAEMKTGLRQDASDAARSHLRAEHLQPLYEVADEVLESVHGLWHLDERIRPFVIESLSPGGDRQRRDEEAKHSMRASLMRASSRSRSTSRCRRSISAWARICASGLFATRASAWVNAIVAIDAAWTMAERTRSGQSFGNERSWRGRIAAMRRSDAEQLTIRRKVCETPDGNTVTTQRPREAAMTEIAPRIVVDEAVHFGKPVIKGTRVPVETIVGKLAGGMTQEQVAEDFGIAKEDVLAALAYAAKSVAGERIRAVR